jgi:hypothetical protein
LALDWIHASSCLSSTDIDEDEEDENEDDEDEEEEEGPVRSGESRVRST